MIQTMLVEDDLYIQKYFAERLEANGGFRLVGVYRDAFEAERHCDRTVQLILMDVQTQHKHSGLAAAGRIKQAFPNVKILVVTSLVDPEVLTKARTGVADSLWYKDHGTAELLDVIRRTLAGEHVFPDTAPAVEMEDTMSDQFSPRQLSMVMTSSAVTRLSWLMSAFCAPGTSGVTAASSATMRLISTASLMSTALSRFTSPSRVTAGAGLVAAFKRSGAFRAARSW